MSEELLVKVIPDIVGLIIKGAISTETEISITYDLCGDFVIVISISIILVMKNTLDSILKIYWETNFIGIFRENTNSPSAFCKADTRKLRSNIYS